MTVGLEDALGRLRGVPDLGGRGRDGENMGYRVGKGY